MDEINERAKRALIVTICLLLFILFFFGLKGFIITVVCFVSVDLIITAIMEILDYK